MKTGRELDFGTRFGFHAAMRRMVPLALAALMLAAVGCSPSRTTYRSWEGVTTKIFTVECPDCDATGYAPYPDKCGRCNGNRRLDPTISGWEAPPAMLQFTSKVYGDPGPLYPEMPGEEEDE